MVRQATKSTFEAAVNTARSGSGSEEIGSSGGPNQSCDHKGTPISCNGIAAAVNALDIMLTVKNKVKPMKTGAAQFLVCFFY